jgi:hypothetical protein
MLVSEQGKRVLGAAWLPLLFLRFNFCSLICGAMCGVTSHRVILGDLALFNPFRINTSEASRNC